MNEEIKKLTDEERKELEKDLKLSDEELDNVAGGIATLHRKMNGGKDPCFVFRTKGDVEIIKEKTGISLIQCCYYSTSYLINKGFPGNDYHDIWSYLESIGVPVSLRN